MDALSGASVETRPAVAALEARRALAADFAACRRATLALFGAVERDLFRRQIHPAYSPLGWHLGHIAYTEALWLLDGGHGVTTPALARAFAVDGLPKAERGAIPEPSATFDYLARVRLAVLTRLADPRVAIDEAAWRFVLQHEAQHAETATFLHALSAASFEPRAVEADTRPIAFMHVRGGPAAIGHDGPSALDNERSPYRTNLAGFQLARAPVTEAQFAAFVADGGYARRALWTDVGWTWREAAGVTHPSHWRGVPELAVCGVNAHEADAFCRWAGARLPTEFEWEHAARHLVASAGSGNLGGVMGGTVATGQFDSGTSEDGVLDLLGNVWEWTASIFAPYTGFRPWPYEGYSQAWFDGRHRVLRGGSWATRDCAVRPSFRNWYLPEIREAFTGFRCARDDLA